MGYYINVGLKQTNKANDIKKLYEATEITEIPKWENLPSDKIVVAVVENSVFDAALVCVDRTEHDFIRRTIGEEQRPVTLLLMDRKTAFKCCGYNG